MNKHLTNYHSHCDFCDGRAPMEDFVRSAIEYGFSAYGISSHSPLPEYVGNHSVLAWDRVEAYLAEIERLKAKYAGQIEIYASMEIDYIDSEHNPANAYFQALPLDYRIGSVHFLKVAPNRVIDADTRPDGFLVSLKEHYDNDIQRLVTDYFDAKMRMIELGGIDFVGHADKISMNASTFQPGITTQKWYQDQVNDYFEYIAQRGMMLEINTKALHQVGLFFPNEEHFATLNRLSVPLVVNSDAHYPHLVNSGRIEAIDRLRAVGYRTIRELHNGSWKDVTI